MNSETKDTMEALGIKTDDAGAKNPTDGGVDYKAKYEAAMQELASAKVEQGRVKRLDGDLKAAKSRIAELERQTAIGELPEELSDVPTSIKETALHLSQHVAQKAVADIDGRMARLEQSVEEGKRVQMARLSEDFVAQLNQKFPEFVKGLKDGGAFKSAWDEYQLYNKASIEDAFSRLDINALSYHIERFYESHGVDPSGGRDPNAAPDPRGASGGAGAQPNFGTKKVYTPEKWEGEFDDLQTQYERGAIGANEYAARRQDLLNAYKEGRVKPA